MGAPEPRWKARDMPNRPRRTPAAMLHCHLLRHEDSGMMGQFVVVNPGEAAGTIEGAQHDH